MAVVETTRRIRRVYLKFSQADAGMMKLSASLTPPSYSDDPVLVVLSAGVLPLGQPLSLTLVNDPTQNPALRGPAGADGKNGIDGRNGVDGQPGKDGAPGAAGLSAYQVARQNGYGGTETQWLASLVGATGASAYDIARQQGYGGTQTQWIASLKGADGRDGLNGSAGRDGAAATVAVGTVTAGAVGSAPRVTNSGTSNAAVLNFTLPAPATGATGPAGPSAIAAPTARTITAGTAYQASDKTKPALITINLTSSASLSISGGQTHTADVLIGSTAASVTGTNPSGMAIAKYSNSNTGAIAVGLALATIAGQSATIALPAGWYFAVRVTSGTVTITSAFDQALG